MSAKSLIASALLRLMPGIHEEMCRIENEASLRRLHAAFGEDYDEVCRFNAATHHLVGGPLDGVQC